MTTCVRNKFHMEKILVLQNGGNESNTKNREGVGGRGVLLTEKEIRRY